MAFRHFHSGWRAGCCGGAATTCPRASPMPGAIVFTVLLVILEIRHYITGGDIYQPVNAITEAAIDVNAGLALTIGARTRARADRQHRPQRGCAADRGADVVAIVFDLIIVITPRFRRRPVTACSSIRSCSPTACRPCSRSSLALIARTTRPLALSRRRRQHGGDPGVVLFDARGAAFLPRRDARAGRPATPSNTAIRTTGSSSALPCSRSASFCDRSRRGCWRSASSR